MAARSGMVDVEQAASAGAVIKLFRVENLGKRSLPFAGRKTGWQFPFHNSPLSARRIRKLWPYFLFHLSERVEADVPEGLERKMLTSKGMGSILQ